MSDGLCAFGDCIGETIGFAVIGVVVGFGGAYLIGQYGNKGARASLPQPRPRRVPADEGEELGRYRKRKQVVRFRRRKSLGDCGCGR